MTLLFSRLGTRRRAPREGVLPDRLPPGQHLPRGWPVLHYGPVPTFDEQAWELQVFGATGDGTDVRMDWARVSALPRVEVRGDLHCVTKFSVLDNVWTGICARTLLSLVPPHPEVSHVMVWGEYGYSANLRLADVAGGSAVFATHRNGERLTPEHGFPLRLVVPHLYAWKGPKWVRAVEYLTADRRGFWEERGYHNGADPWREQRYSYQEVPGEGPDF